MPVIYGCGSSSVSGASKKARRPRPRQRHIVELFEARRLLSTFTVTSLADDGSAGTLRWAIAQANQGAGQNTIDIPSSLSGRINLDQGPLEVTSGNLTIEAPGANVLTLQITTAGPAFIIEAGATADVSGVTISSSLPGNIYDFNSNGGAIRNLGTMTVDSCAVTQASAYFGGAISNVGTLTIINSAIYDNSAANGGAVGSNGSLKVINSSLSGNTAWDGSAVMVQGGTFTAINCTISAEPPVTGSAVLSINGYGIDATLYNTILAGDWRYLIRGNLDQNLAPGQRPSSHNLIESYSSAADQNGNIFTYDPLLGPLQNNGGATPTMALLPGSEAINDGDASLAVDGDGAPLVSDQRRVGFPRVRGFVDIGAFEAPYDPFHVTTASDGSTPGDGVTSLREAIAAAQQAGGRQLIDFDPTVFPSGRATTITLGSPLSISGIVVVEGPGANALVVTANGAGRVFNVNGGALDMSGVTVSDGNSSNGGGISNEMGLLSLTDCVIANCSSDQGGAINNDGTLIINHVDFEADSATMVGGAVFNETNQNATISSSTFSDCTANWDGGAIYNLGTLNVALSTFKNNAAFRGGALFNQNKAEVDTTTMTLNSASSGGAIFNTAGSLSLFESLLSNNSAQSNGGGIETQNYGTTVVNSSTLYGNTADIGGAIDADAALTIYSSTLTMNSATQGGGIFINSNIGGLLYNSIVAANSSGSTSSDITGAFNSLPIYGASNLIGTGGAGNLATENNNFINVQDAHLGPLKDNGGPTMTVAPLPGSPAINAGSAIFATDLAGNPLLFDQRGDGFSRVVGGVVDIGALETGYQLSHSLVVNTTQDLATPPDGSTSLRSAIAYARTLGNGTITFDPAVFPTGQTSTIYLLGQLELSGTITIVSPSPANVRIDGSDSFSMVNVKTNAMASFSGLTFANGHAIASAGNPQGDGGAIRNAGTLSITNCVFSGDAADSAGGAIYNNGTLTISSSEISNDDPNYRWAIDNEGTATITNSSVTNNSNAILSRGYLTIIACEVTNNGGGVYTGGTLQVVASTFSSNTGGAIHNGNGTATLVNSTFTGNSASQGGAIYSGGTLVATNCTISGNVSQLGGGLCISSSYGNTSIYNTIVAGNAQTAGGSVDDIAGPLDRALPAGQLPSSNNLIGTGGYGGLAPGHGNIVGIDQPLLGPLQNNGGPTDTVALLPGSPAIDGGNSALALDATGHTLPTDGRGAGFARTVGGHVDIGAVEYESVLVVNTSADTVNPSDGVLSLREAVAQADQSGATIPIGFDPALFNSQHPATIVLGTPLDILHAVNIAGPGAAALTIQCTNSSGPILQVENAATLRLRGLSLVGGNNSSGNGGAITNHGSLVIAGCVLSGNSTSGRGGALYSDGTATVAATTVSGNSASQGGGVYSDGNLSIYACTIAANVVGSGGNGGGIRSTGSLVLNATTISGNAAGANGLGGGIYASGTVTSITSTLFGNTAQSGGAIYSLGSMTLTNVTLSTNRAATGGGVSAVSGVAALHNTIAAGNTTLDGNTSSDLFSTQNASLRTDFSDLVGVATLLAPIGYYGGLTQTMPPLPGSPAVRRGSDSYTDGAGIVSDQRGLLCDNNPYFGVDIGAVITGGYSVSFVAGSSPQSTPVGMAFPHPLALSITPVNGFDPVDGGVVTFSGANLLTYLSTTAPVITGGRVSVTVTAGDIVGFGGVQATLSNSSSSSYFFNLTEQPLPGLPHYVVTTLSDIVDPNDGVTSLREAVDYANRVQNQAITFDPSLFPPGGSETLHLTRMLEIGGLANSIVGPGANLLKITADVPTRLIQADSRATLTGLTLTGGNAGPGNGGAVLANGTLLIIACTVSGNTAASGGGIFVNGNNGGLILGDSTFFMNTATAQGGAVYAPGNSSISNCTFVANKASLNGGAIYCSGVPLTIWNSTVCANSSASGGGLFILPTNGTHLYNSIIALNTALNGTTPNDIVGTVGQVGIGVPPANNLIGTGGSGGLTNQVGGNMVGIADPLLSPLGDYGGPTLTMPPLPTSPAIDAGDSTLSAPGLTADERGVTRVLGLNVDIGAVERVELEAKAGSANGTEIYLRAEPGDSIVDYWISPDTFGGAPTASFPIQTTGVLVDTLSGSPNDLTIDLANGQVFPSIGANIIRSTGGSISITVLGSASGSTLALGASGLLTIGGLGVSASNLNDVSFTDTGGVNNVSISGPVPMTLNMGQGSDILNVAAESNATVNFGASNGDLTINGNGNTLLILGTGDPNIVFAKDQSGGGPPASTGSIGGTVFNDTNVNGRQDSGETGITGRKVFLDLNHNGRLDANEPRAVTAADGSYQFTGLAAMDYLVRETTVGGWRATTVTSYSVSLSAVPSTSSGQAITGRDFGQTDLSRIAGFVFNDKNANGKRNPGEAPLVARVVYIDANNNGKLDAAERRTASAADGSFSLDGLTAGNYVVREIAPSGWANVAGESRIAVRLRPAVVVEGLMLGQRRK